MTGPQANDLTVSRAESYRLAPDRAGEVSLTAPVKPMVVTMYDERGGSRKIQLPPISFGSQRLTDNRTPVSMIAVASAVTAMSQTPASTTPAKPAAAVQTPSPERPQRRPARRVPTPPA